MNINMPTAEDLLKAGVHFGHQKKHWHPKMQQFIYSTHQKVHIIDLFKTIEQLKKAAQAAYDVAKKGEKIIFLATKPQSRELVTAEAKRCGALYVTERWIGGTLTNFEEIKKNRDSLLKYQKGLKEGDYKDLTKKERLMIQRKVEKLKKVYEGLVGLKSLPGLIYVVDARRERTAVAEAQKVGVPVIALTDTNTDPSNIDYVIPGNDDAIKSVSLITKVISDAVFAGYKDFGKSGSSKVVVDKSAKKVKNPSKESNVSSKKDGTAKKSSSSSKKNNKDKPTKKSTKAKKSSKKSSK